MAEWIIPGNPKEYNVVGAFHELKKIDWKQSTNIKEGDIVYVYVSGDIRSLRFKCRANKVNLDVPDIDDQKFDISGKFDGHKGRYMELEMLEEFEGPEYTREELLNHGFQSPQGPMRMPSKVKSYLTSLEGMKLLAKKFAKNMILYGPPGTGKTYSTAKYAVEICESDKETDLNDYSAVMKRYRALMAENRISFVTFHQSYSYEEFIEGIRPLMPKRDDNEPEQKEGLKYDIVDGVFKEFCSRAKKDIITTDKFTVSDNARIWKATIRAEVKQDCFDNDRVRIDWGFDSDGAYGFVNDIHAGDIIITTDGSRSFITGIAVAKEDDAYSIDDESDATTRNVQWLAKDLNEDIVAINGDKILHRKTVARVPHMSVGDLIKIAVKHNPDLQDTKVAKNKQPYVFIIDEINRGNISKIFGELITLIEDTKRDGMEECIPATLPYSGESFTVPENVYIIGTMNTADRSIALMDTALRRRFQFIEMMPKPEVLEDIHVKDLDVAAMLKTINERITFLYDREHTIGHAFFTKLKKSPTIETLQTIFEKSVIPLLQEYFYEDYRKIQLVLGDNGKTDSDLKFIKDEKVEVKSIFKGSVDNVNDLPEFKYSVNKGAFSKLESYKQIM